MSTDTQTFLAKNIRELREARGLTQQQLADLSGIPRPTWANLESGSSNPTLTVLVKVASALHVPIEELIGKPRAECQYFKAGTLPQKRRGEVVVQQLLPMALPGLAIERLQFAPGSRMGSVPHTAGTYEYLTCESGEVELTVAGESLRLQPGDVVAFRGDQKHSYRNLLQKISIAYSVIAFAPVDSPRPLSLQARG